MPELRILPLAERPDLAALVEGWCVAEWGRTDPAVFVANRAARLREGRHPDARERVFVAVDADGVCRGTASLLNDDLPGDLRNPWLASVYVPPAARRRGIASRLVAAVEAEAVAQGFAALWLFTATVPQLYAGLGWSAVDRGHYQGGPVTIMTKALPPPG